MKKLLLIAGVAVALAASADYTSQTIGVTKITTTNRNTIVAVPFASLTNRTAAISANDLVCTNGLPIGTTTATTQLLVFKDDGYLTWELAPEGWVPVANGAHTEDYVGANSTIASGGAIWVVLPSAPNPSQDIYIYGDFSTEPTESSVVAGVANLVANPLQSDATFTLSGTPAKGDVIIIPSDGSAQSYSYGRGGWVNNGNSFELASIVVKVGQGFWYVSKSTSGVTKITWGAKSN